MFMNWKQKNGYDDDQLLKRGLDTPPIWIYVDDTDVNSRWWADFGARSSRVLNLPFLNLCYQTIVAAAGGRYHVEVIGGLADAERLLGSLPAPMRNKRIPLRDEELTYLRVAFLAPFQSCPRTRLLSLARTRLRRTQVPKAQRCPISMQCGRQSHSIHSLTNGSASWPRVSRNNILARRSATIRTGIFSLLDRQPRMILWCSPMPN
jgi:hypothetical protein